VLKVKAIDKKMDFIMRTLKMIYTNINLLLAILAI